MGMSSFSTCPAVETRYRQHALRCFERFGLLSPPYRPHFLNVRCLYGGQFSISFSRRHLHHYYLIIRQNMKKINAPPYPKPFLLLPLSNSVSSPLACKDTLNREAYPLWTVIQFSRCGEPCRNASQLGPVDKVEARDIIQAENGEKSEKKTPIGVKSGALSSVSDP